jgi:predicted MPP superfamily phosphohydrolase
MEIQKCSDFINEARVSKDQVVADLLTMLKEKPNVEMTKLANERGIYSLSGMKSYLSKYNSTSVGNALQDLQNDKKSGLKTISVKVSVWNEMVPYWYIGLTEDKAKKLKEQYEEEELNKNKKSVDKQVATKKANKATADARKTVKKTVTKKAAKKTATKKAPKPSK